MNFTKTCSNKMIRTFEKLQNLSVNLYCTYFLRSMKELMSIYDARIFLHNCIFKVAACSYCVCERNTCILRCASTLEDQVNNTVFRECGCTTK